MAILAVDSASRVLLSEMHSHPPDKQNFVTVAITFNREFYNLTLQRAIGKTPATVIAERNEEIENLRARLAEADSALLEADVLLEEFRDPSRAVRLYTERRAALKGRGA